MSKCRWCEEEAIGAVEVEPARYGLVQGVDRTTGQRAMARVMTRHAIMADACVTHAKMVNEQPQAMVRRRARVSDEQTTIFDISA